MFSHVGQDDWVVRMLAGKRDGYFLDFGALDGVLTSNTLLLERDYGWSGVLVEANPVHAAQADAARTSSVYNLALWDATGDTVRMRDAHGLSTAFPELAPDVLDSFDEAWFEVDTITANDLLEAATAPSRIDYMSLDVEGAEILVLEGLDLARWSITLASIEHNHHPERQARIRGIMAAHGYDVEQRFNDDLFWRADLL